MEVGRDIPYEKLVELSPILRHTVSLPLAIKSVHELGRFPQIPFQLMEGPHGKVDDPVALELDAALTTAFQAHVKRRLSGTDRKAAFVFIHGYNNSFADAAYVMAELWHFLGREGVPIFYSWPAGIGSLRGYNYDRESGEFTNFHLKQFLRRLAAIPELEEIHLISHSRGTDVITTALRELFIESRAAGRDPNDDFRIKNLILAAPDLDLEVASQRISAEKVPMGVGRTTLYTSGSDRALGLADWLFMSAQRLGRLLPGDLSESMEENLKHFDGINLIRVTSKTSFIGHGYFHSDPAVCSDLILLMRDGRAPGAEHGRPLIPTGPNMWELPYGYPDDMPDDSKSGN